VRRRFIDRRRLLFIGFDEASPPLPALSEAGRILAVREHIVGQASRNVAAGAAGDVAGTV